MTTLQRLGLFLLPLIAASAAAQEVPPLTGGLQEPAVQTNADLDEIPEGAAEDARHLCDQEDGIACRQAAEAVLQGHVAAQGDLDALRLLERGCELGDGTACFELGGLHQAGIGFPPEPELAATIYLHGCHLGSAEACLALGLQYEGGIGVRQNYQDAKTWYRQACALGSAAGCYNLAVLYRHGHGAGRDVERAVHSYEQACEQDYGLACLEVASFHLRGQTVVEDADRALVLYLRACDLGQSRGCEAALCLQRGGGQQCD